MIDRSKTVVLLIDWDNLQICHSRDAPGTELDLGAVTALAQSYGTLVSARAYAEWNLPSERLAVYKAGIEPVFAPVMRPESGTREGKSLADTVMVADGVDLLWTVAPDVFVLVTSDKDMIPLARIAKQRGAAVVVLGSDLTAIPLVELSNVFITYRQLLRELDRTSGLDAPSGRAPARERRPPIETRRPGTEPFGGRRVASQPARAPSRPAVAAPPMPVEPPAAVSSPVPSEPLATAVPVPSPMLAGDGAEMDGPISAEGITRRRRRRGRSRGRGGAGNGPELPDTQPAGDEVVAVAQDERPENKHPVPAEDASLNVALESPIGAEPAVEPVEEPSPPPPPPPRSRRAPSRRPPSPISAGPLVFSEFGPSGSPNEPTAAPADEPPPLPVREEIQPIEGVVNNGESPDSAPAALGASEPPDAASSAALVPSNGNVVEDVPAEGVEGEAPAKPARRRRTRASG